MSPWQCDRRPAVVSVLLLLLRRQASATGTTACAFDGKVSWDGPRTSLKLLPCNDSDPHQRWAGATLSGDGRPSVITSVATGECLSTVVNDPVSVVPCGGDGSAWLYNATNMTIAVSKAASGTLKGKGVGGCIDIMGGSGPNVDIWTCHPAGDRDAPNQQLVYNATDQTLRSPHPALAGRCFLLNRTQVNPWVRTPCIWPNQVPAGLPVAQSVTLKGISVLENATVIPYYVRSSGYCRAVVSLDSCGTRLNHSESAVSTDPLIAAHHRAQTRSIPPLIGGGGSSSVSVNSASPNGFGSTTGSAIVSGGHGWRNLSVAAVGGALVENGYPMLGRYTSANAVINGTWWTGTYGLGLSSESNSLSIEIGPFIGFRHSINDGKNWSEPTAPDGSQINVSKNLFGEHPPRGPGRGLPLSGEPLGDPAGIKFGSPHVVDHGPENVRSPDGALYMVAGGCLSRKATENCTWISGDGIFVARAVGFDAAQPDSLNDASHWEFWGGEDGGWVQVVHEAQPVFTWKGRVGAVTATLHPTLKKYFFCVTAPSTHPWVNTGPFDTYILEAPTLTGPFSLVTYMPRFGMQAYFVSLPSAWMGVLVDGESGMAATIEHGTDEHDAVLTFSANFACHIEGCAPNILNAGYGANLLPVRFLNA